MMACPGASRAQGRGGGAGAAHRRGVAVGRRAGSPGVPRSPAPAPAGQQRHPLLPRRRGRVAGRPRFRRHPRRRLLDSRDPALRRHQARSGRGQVVQAAVPLAGPGDDPRPSLQHRLSIRSDLPVGAVPGRSGPGPTWRSCCSSAGSAPDPTRWQYAQDAGFVHYWWKQDYKTAAEWFDRASRIEGRALVAAFDGGQHAGGGRRPAVVSAAVAAALRDHGRHLGAQQRATETRAASRPSMRSTRWPSWCGVSRRSGDGLPPPGTNWSRRGGSGAFRWIRRARRTSLKPDAPGGVALSEKSSLHPLPPQFLKGAGPKT